MSTFNHDSITRVSGKDEFGSILPLNSAKFSKGIAMGGAGNEITALNVTAMISDSGFSH
jgi:hypothetical protein